VRALSGVGKQMEKRLKRYGILTVRDLAAKSKDEMRAIWGGVGGEIMYQRIRGEEQHEFGNDTSSISHSSVLGPEHRNPDDAFAVLNRLTQKAAMRLRKAVYFASAHKARDRGGLHIAFNHIPDPKTDK